MQKLVAAVDDALRVEGPEAVDPAPRGGQRLPQQRVRARREGPVPFYGEGPPRAGALVRHGRVEPGREDVGRDGIAFEEGREYSSRGASMKSSNRGE